MTGYWVSDVPHPSFLPTSVIRERMRQIELWGIQHLGPEWWLTILSEEVGEFAKAVQEMRLQDGSFEHMYDELTQVAAVALSALCDLNGYRTSEPPIGYHWPTVPAGQDPARWWEQGS